jgi:hypothetical protein
VDARALTGIINTNTSTIVLSKRMFLLLGDVTIVSPVSPIVDIRANGVQIIGTGAFYAGNYAGTILQDSSNSVGSATIYINNDSEPDPNKKIISGVTVKGLNLLVSSGLASGPAIYLFRSQRNTFEDLYIAGHTSSGTAAIYFAGADYFNHFRRITTGTSNQSVELTGTSSDPSNFNWIEDSTLGNAGPGAAIRLAPNASHNVIRNVGLEGFSGGIGGVEVRGPFNILDSLHIEGGSISRPIYINASDTVVKNSALDSSPNYGIVVDTGSVRTVIDACRFTNNFNGGILIGTGASSTRVVNGLSLDSVFVANNGTGTKIWP